ncbi:MAG: RDD family protein [Myxococcota bacterium]
MQRERLGVLRVELPEHGFVDLPLAGLGRRGFAAIIDFMLVLLCITVALLVLGFISGASLAASGPVLMSVAIALPVLLPMGAELLGSGASPGKRWMQLRVVGSDGHPASQGQLILRNIMRLIDFLPASYGLGLVMLAVTGRSQRLGDLVAGTLVVSEANDAFEHAGPALERQLPGVPPLLAQALQSLSEREADLEEEVFRERRTALLNRFRELRPDWGALEDEPLWNELLGSDKS